jgi:heme/copper-type cytochrome/quinol oxidase subunit 2
MTRSQGDRSQRDGSRGDRTRGDRTRTARMQGTGVLVALVLVVALAAAAAAEHHETDPAHANVIQVVSTNVQGKNVYIPSTIVVEEDRPATLSIFNTTEVPHGFAIDGLGIEVVLPPHKEFEVKLPALDGNKIYKIHCQLHPPHRTAQLVVLDTD